MLDDVLRDAELRRIAAVRTWAGFPAPPLDDAFRTGLRRQLMQEAWAKNEGGFSLLRRAFGPPGFAWVGAAAGLVLIASVGVWGAPQQPGGVSEAPAGRPPGGQRRRPLPQP